MKQLLLIALLLQIPTASVAGGLPDRPSECQLSVYAIGPESGSPGKRIISPEQVTSAKLGKSTIVKGGVTLKVTLTVAGAEANKKYTSKHIGDKVAIFCNGEEVSKVTIAGRSAGTFVVEGIKWP